MAIIGQWVSHPSEIQYTPTSAGPVMSLFTVTKPSNAVASYTIIDGTKPDGTAFNQGADKVTVDGANINFALGWNVTKSVGKARVRVLYYTSSAGARQLLGETDYIEVDVVEELAPADPPDWTFTPVNVSELNSGHVTGSIAGVTIAAGSTLKNGDTIVLTADSGHTLLNASVTYDFGGGTKKFVVSADGKTASLKWTFGAVEQLSFVVDSEVTRTVIYTLKPSDIKTGYSVQRNGATASSGTAFYEGDVMAVVCDSTHQFGRDFAGAVKLPYMGGGDGAKFTQVGTTETANWTVRKATNSIAYTSLIVQVEDRPQGYTWKQADQDVLTKARASMTAGGVLVDVGSAIGLNQELVITTQSGWIIKSASINGFGETITFTVDRSRTKATANTGQFDFSMGITIAVNTEQVTPDQEGSFNKVYSVDAGIMALVNKNRFKTVEVGSGETGTFERVDYGNQILGLVSLPFAIDPSYIAEPESVQLGELTLNVRAPRVTDDSIRVPLGSIVVPAAVDSTDYVGVTALLYLPRLDPVSIDLEYVIGQTLTVDYLIDVYSGRATVNIESTKTGSVVIQREVDMGFNIPYINFLNQSVDNPNIQVGGDNGITKPRLDLVKSDLILPKGFYTVPVVAEGTLASYNGYATVEFIQLDFKAPLSEKEMLTNKLNSGVIINA